MSLDPTGSATPPRGEPSLPAESPGGRAADRRERTEFLRARARSLIEEISKPGAGPVSGDVVTLAEELSHLQAQLEAQNDALRAAHDALESSRDRYTDLYHLAPVGYVTLDAAGLMTEVNHTFATMVGRPIADLLRTPFSAVVDPVDRALFLGRYRAFFKSPEGKSIELKLVRETGGPGVHVKLDARVGERRTGIPSVDAALARLLVIVTDVTERKNADERSAQLEAQLLQAQKMEALGRLAGGISHDFNNLLTIISCNVELIVDGLAIEDPLREAAIDIRSTVDRAARLTQPLLLFSRRHPTDAHPIDLNQILAGMDTMLRRVIGEDIALRTILAPAPCVIVANTSQIEQCVVNLAVNARDAMAEGGTLRLQTSIVHLDEATAARHRGMSAGLHVELTVADSGSGMTRETLAHLFEPFFTTKPVGAGTGLGLSVVFGVVEQCHGGIEVDSEPGSGSTFRLYFPLSTARAVDEPIAPTRRPPAVQGRSILVVEDEAPLRQLLMRILRHRGYVLLQASNGIEALELSDRHPGHIDMVLTDVVMPGMTGVELVHRLVEKRPTIKVAFMSGYANDALRQRGIDSGARLLTKPFTPEQLTGFVHEVLEETAAEPRRPL